jgi:hypothetical protein
MRSLPRKPALAPVGFTGQESDDDREERHAPELERQLLRRGVLRMSAGRCDCSECGRSPLVGERLQVFAGRGGEELALCDLCLSSRAAPPGKPLRMERMLAGERPLRIRSAA